MVYTIAVLVVLLIGVPMLVLLIRDRVENVLSRHRNSPEKLEAERRAYEVRLQNPDWAFFERHLERAVPQALRDLFANHRTIVAQSVDYGGEDVISTFGALDEQELIDSRSWLGFDVVPIATSDFGDPIYLRPGATESNAVYITCHDGGGTTQLAPDVEAFLRRLRTNSRP